MSDFRTRIYLSLSVFGVVLGVGAGMVFADFGNNWAVLWALISASYALMNVLLHYLYYYNKLEEYYNINVLQSINTFAFISAVLFTTLLVWYIFEICYFQLPMLPIKDSYAIIAVWCFMSSKWACMLVRTCYRYIKILSNSGRPLLQI